MLQLAPSLVAHNHRQAEESRRMTRRAHGSKDPRCYGRHVLHEQVDDEVVGAVIQPRSLAADLLAGAQDGGLAPRIARPLLLDLAPAVRAAVDVADAGRPTAFY